MTDGVFDSGDMETFRSAIELWGMEAQFNMAEEEAAELIVALKHYRRGTEEREDVLDELADIRIMYEQMAMFMGREDVERKIDEKMYRLGERIMEESQ